MKDLLVILFISCVVIDLIDGHGRLKVPPARTTMWREGFPTIKNYNDAELNCGGFSYQWNQQGGKCGVCGDPWEGPRKNEVASGKYATGIITRNYTQGQILDITVEITANHGGWHSFYLCPHKDLTEDCFQKYLLPDVKGQTKFPINKADSVIRMKLQLPPNLTCKQCVLRWKWVCGNRWGCGDGYNGCCVGCGKKQEQFYGCSDIAILSNGNTPLPRTTIPTKIPTTTRKPVIKTTQKPTTVSPSDNDNPWIKCPFKMICNPIGPYVQGASGTMCMMQCQGPYCPLGLCKCSCP